MGRRPGLAGVTYIDSECGRDSPGFVALDSTKLGTDSRKVLRNFAGVVPANSLNSRIKCDWSE